MWSKQKNACQTWSIWVQQFKNSIASVVLLMPLLSVLKKRQLQNWMMAFDFLIWECFFFSQRSILTWGKKKNFEFLCFYWSNIDWLLGNEYERNFMVFPIYLKLLVKLYLLELNRQPPLNQVSSRNDWIFITWIVGFMNKSFANWCTNINQYNICWTSRELKAEVDLIRMSSNEMWAWI